VVEAEWVQKAQAGDREACIRLLREVETAVYRTAYYLMGNEHDALDATQEALLRIYNRISSYKGQSRFETWAQRIVTNICIDHFRRKKREVPYPEEIHPADPKAGPAVERAGVVMDLREAIRRLPPPQRTAIVLRYMHDFSYEEIAEAMELPLNTVKSHLFRARKKLQEWLSEYQEGGVVP
jgi:RNA polymerase sigma factor (sigma-70 family)